MSRIVGHWRIKWMEMWDQEFVDLVEPGHFQFDEEGLGFFVFGAVQGQIDFRASEDKTRVDFSWSGNDDGREKSGRGWFEFSTAGIARGIFFFHCGDESAVELEKKT